MRGRICQADRAATFRQCDALLASRAPGDAALGRGSMQTRSCIASRRVFESPGRVPADAWPGKVAGWQSHHRIDYRRRQGAAHCLPDDQRADVQATKVHSKISCVGAVRSFKIRDLPPWCKIQFVSRTLDSVSCTRTSRERGRHLVRATTFGGQPSPA